MKVDREGRANRLDFGWTGLDEAACSHAAVVAVRFPAPS